MVPGSSHHDIGDAPMSEASNARQSAERDLGTAAADETSASISERAARPRDFSVTQLLQAFGAVAAPTGLVAGCFYYFGYVSTREKYEYFAIDPSMLALSTTDYLRNSVSSTFWPVIGLILVALVAVACHLVLRRVWQPARNPSRSWLLPAVVAAVGILAIVQYRTRLLPEPRLLVAYGVSFPRIYIAPGIVLICYAAYLCQRWSVAVGGPTLWPENGSIVPYVLLGLAGSLLALSLFFVVYDFAVKHGGTGGQDLAAHLREERPAVRVYSTVRLRLHNPDVHEQPLPGMDSDYRFCYTGLRLLIWSNNRHFLLPEYWGVGNRVTIILPENDTTRVELIGQGEAKALCP
jgi:hypothetical protein